MKIRTGFVSNSSSSSFVLIGVKATPENKKKLEKKYPRKTDPEDGEVRGKSNYDADYNYHERLDEVYDIHYLGDEYNTDKIGVLLGYGDESSVEFTQEEIDNAFNKVKSVFGDDCKPKLYAGTVVS